MRRFLWVPLLLLACSTAPVTSEGQLALEQAFEESMRGAVLDGQFTLIPLDPEDASASEGDAPKLRTERYEIEKVVKRSGDIWTFHARMVFGETDVTLPVPVRLTWAGDTPIVSVTDLGLPGMRSYTARVTFYRDSYSGMWWGGKYGGHLFGRIIRGD